jgi:hypothetical protein
LKDEKVIKEIKEDKHHLYNNVYIFSQMNTIIYLVMMKKYFNVLKMREVKKIKITEKNISRNVPKSKRISILISEPIYTSNNKFASLKWILNRKALRRKDEYFGVLKSNFEKR